MIEPPQKTRVDIVVVGAGLVGTPLAQVLGKEGWSVALLDAKKCDHRVPVIDEELTQRCTALNLGTQQWFERHGLWPVVAPDACPIEQVMVSHKGYFGSTRLSADELRVKALGYVVNNDYLSASLLSELAKTKVRYLPGANVSSVEAKDDEICVHFGSSSLRARLLVAADGISSVVRESMGIRTRQVEYEQFGILGTLLLENEHHNVAYERFTASGPLAMLPRTGKIVSFVDCINARDVDEISAMSDSAYIRRLQNRFGFRLGRFKTMGSRFVTPLMRIEATQQVAHRTVLLGNAVRLLHPVGGQGYNLAVRDIAHLHRLLAKPGLSSCSSDSDYEDLLSTDPGHPELLARFVKERAGDQQRTVQFTEALARGFRGESALPSHLRALGMLGLDNLPPLRRRFARFTMGLAG